MTKARAEAQLDLVFKFQEQLLRGYAKTYGLDRADLSSNGTVERRKRQGYVPGVHIIFEGRKAISSMVLERAVHYIALGWA
jgi:hypothetical protein